MGFSVMVYMTLSNYHSYCFPFSFPYLPGSCHISSNITFSFLTEKDREADGLTMERRNKKIQETERGKK